MAKAYSYTRFSSGRQAKGDSQARQNAMISSWLEKNKEVEYDDLASHFGDSARSGYSGENVKYGLGEFLKAIENKVVTGGDYLLVESIDRLSRQAPMNVLEIIQSIISKGISIVTLEDGATYNTDSLNTDQSSLFILIGKIHQAHQYSKTLSNRVADANKRKREAVRNGERTEVRRPQPYWLTSDGKLIPERANLVKDIIDLYLKGYGPKKILIDMFDKYPETKKIHPSTIRKWLLNPAIKGTWRTVEGEEIDNVSEPLVDLETYYQIQRELQRRTKQMSPEQTYQLSGLVECSSCGSRFYFRRKKNNDQFIVYANCSTYLKRGHPFCSNNTTWPYEVLTFLFDSYVDQVLVDYHFEVGKNELGIEIGILNGQIEELETRFKKVLKVYEVAEDEGPVLERLEEIHSQLGVLRDEKSLKERLARSDDKPVEIPIQQLEKLQKKLNKKRVDSKSDVVLLRETVKKAGFRIKVDGNRAELILPNIEEGKSNVYELIKRSTRHRCYILKAHLENDTFDYYFAIAKEGELAKAPTSEELFEKLEEIKQRQ